MSARRIARELAVIVFPQLPKDRARLEKIELSALVARAVQMLVDYGRQSLADADALLCRLSAELTEAEIEHPLNASAIDAVEPVPLTSDQARRALDLVERAIHLVSESLDIPEIALSDGQITGQVKCSKCSHPTEYLVTTTDRSETLEFLFRLVSACMEHRQEIDRFIAEAKGRWKVERMVSIDRDILRLACAEAFYMSDVPVPVVINEAVELSHRFADEKAARYINGILGDLFEAAKHYRATGKFLGQDNPAQPVG